MDEELGRIAQRIEALTRDLGAIERRVQRLEGAKPPEPVASAAAADPVAPAVAPPAGAEATRALVSALSPASVLAWVGRTLVVLGGAFLLRAITESGVLTRGPGTVVGFTYALVWLWFADRDAHRHRLGSANFHALTAAIIALPLVWEAAVRFELVTPVAAAASLVFLVAAAYAVAWRGRLATVAWIFGLGTSLVGFALALATRAFFPFFGCLLFLAAATLWVGYAHQWRPLARTLAVLTDVGVLLVTSTLFLGGQHAEPVIAASALLTLQLALMLIYLFSFALRALATGRDVGAFAILQTFAVLSIGFGGAFVTSSRAGTGGLLLAVLSMVLAAISYAVVFSIIDRRHGARTNFIFYGTVALVLTIGGCSVLLSELARVVTLGVAALAAGWFGAARSRATLSLHGTIYAVTAALVSGTLAHAFATFVSRFDPAAPSWTASGLVVLGVVAVSSGFPVAMHGRTWGRMSRLPRLTHTTLLVLLLGALAVDLGIRALPRALETDAAVIGVVRTAVLAGAALVLAWIGSSRHVVELTLLVPAVLAAGGVKLVLEDLRSGRPVTLFASMVLYGGALIVAPRWARRRGGSRMPAAAVRNGND